MCKENCHCSCTTDFEFINKAFDYFNCLQPVLPSIRLKDACSGLLVFLFELSSFLENHPDYHGNYQK